MLDNFAEVDARGCVGHLLLASVPTAPRPTDQIGSIRGGVEGSSFDRSAAGAAWTARTSVFSQCDTLGNPNCHAIRAALRNASRAVSEWHRPGNSIAATSQ